MAFLLLEGKQFYNQRWLLGNKISGIEYVGSWRWWASFISYPYSPRFLSHWKKVCVCARAHAHTHACVLLTDMDIVVQTVISALGNLRQEDCYDLKARQGYNKRPHLTKMKRKKKGKNLLLTANGKVGFIHLQKYALLAAVSFSLLRWGSVGPRHVLHRRGHHSQSSWAVGRQR